MSALIICALLVVVNGRPSEYLPPKNVVTVPPNCPNGQEWINGQCREVWPAYDTHNIVTVPPNCPEGQEFINGQCREVWKINGDNTVNIAPNCLPGQVIINEECHHIWRESSGQAEIMPTNVVAVPSNCREGQRYINGQCWDIWRINRDSKNTVAVPPNCPIGQELVNGECRDVWRGINTSSKLLQMITSMFENLEFTRNKRELDEEKPDPKNLQKIIDRNIISVPNQCPSGSRPDALGICRPIFD